MSLTLHHGDCLDVLKTLPDCSIDACVTDPPAGIEFMGKAWDRFVERAPNPSGPQTDEWATRGNPFARQATPRYRGKTGASLLPFQDFIAEVFGEVYRVLKPGAHAAVWALPRTSHHTGMGIERAGLEIRDRLSHFFGSGFPKSMNLGDGRGTALKPACEDWWLARKPLDGTVAANVLAHGTGALNIDACRIEGAPRDPGFVAPSERSDGWGMQRTGLVGKDPAAGRWPANVILDEDAAAELDAQSGMLHSGGYPPEGGQRSRGQTFGAPNERGEARFGGSDGGASRFFYCAKPDRAERHLGVRNTHPTVKPVELMRYLVRLVTPPSGIVLDPFMGSGTTGIAALAEQRSFIGIERSAEYIEIARRRIEADAPLFNREATP